jgi:hypothetical protein
VEAITILSPGCQETLSANVMDVSPIFANWAENESVIVIEARNRSS